MGETSRDRWISIQDDWHGANRLPLNLVSVGKVAFFIVVKPTN
jgi:hypothetical protein